MSNPTLSPPLLRAFAIHLSREEKAPDTVRKYLRDVTRFSEYLKGNPLTKQRAIEYKKQLQSQNYAPRSINATLTALNRLFSFLGQEDCRLKALRLQPQIYCPQEKELSKEEYLRLVSAANRSRNRRMSLILQTICGTGIRVSELPFITAEAVRCGEATVALKGKTRKVFIVKELQKKLLRYLAEQQITTGSVFLTRRGKPIDRTAVWRGMKALCRRAGVSPSKVFPHNLRHLFARTFYRLERDIAKLADLLGHSNINTTRIYIIASGEEHRRRMERMHLIL